MESFRRRLAEQLSREGVVTFIGLRMDRPAAIRKKATAYLLAHPAVRAVFKLPE